jgi:DNA mismatch endonuclease (patch repair protein)
MTRFETDPATTARMRAVRRADTAPEQAVKREVRRLGIRFSSANDDLPGSPDLANRSRRWAVFVHGCFWHRHADCPRATLPRRNRRSWIDKFTKNGERDRRAARALRALGYAVLVVWECETRETERLSHRIRRRLLGAD